MANLFRNRIVPLMLAVVLTGLLGVLPAAAVEEIEPPDVVRVGYYISQDFQEGGDGEIKTGYGYEYLQKIAYYADWEYEYVYGSFSDLLEQLVSGEIDLMAGISETDEHAELLSYPDLPLGDERYYIFGSLEQTRLQSDTPSTFAGARIGITSTSYAMSMLAEWRTENEIDCEVVIYQTASDLLGAMNDGEVDAMVDSESSANYSWAPLIFLGQDVYSICVTQSRPDLLTDLNLAMQEIKASNFFYADELRVKYLTHPTNTSLPLSADESEWLATHDSIRIGYLTDYMPYCGQDDETGEVDGILSDLLANFNELYGMTFELVPFDSYDEMQAALVSSDVRIIFPVYGELSFGESQHMMISDTAVSSTMTMVVRRSAPSAVGSVAVTLSDPFQANYVAMQFPDTTVKYYDDMDECINAVLDGDVDFTLVETALVNTLTDVTSSLRLQMVELTTGVNVSFGIRTRSRHLLAIFNKGITTENAAISSSLVQHAQLNGDYSVREFVKEHSLLILILVIAAFLVIIGFMLAYFRLHTDSQKKLDAAEQETITARYDAEHDSLTGLLNRTSYQALIEAKQHSKSPMAMLVIDVDHFKNINDTYGHETGDQVLIQVARVLEHSFRSADRVIRYAGDEFIVLMQGLTEDDRQIIEAKVTTVNEQLRRPTDDLPGVTISTGAAFSEAGCPPTLFHDADLALYYTKAHGRGGFTVYRPDL